MEYKNVMLISPDTIKGTGDINNNVDDGVLGASIRAAQSVYLQDVIGSNLLEKLQELVYESIITPGTGIEAEENVHYKTLLDDYIRDVLANKVTAEICIRISLKIRNIGVAQNSDTNIQGASLTDIKYLRNQYDTYYNHSLNRMIDFLKENRNAYPELDQTCGCGKRKPDLNNRYGNTGLWLG